MREGVHDCWSNGNRKSSWPREGGQWHGLCQSWYKNGELAAKCIWVNGQKHDPGRDKDGAFYFLYGRLVAEEEYRIHILIEKLAGIE